MLAIAGSKTLETGFFICTILLLLVHCHSVCFYLVIFFCDQLTFEITSQQRLKDTHKEPLRKEVTDLGAADRLNATDACWQRAFSHCFTTSSLHLCSPPQISKTITWTIPKRHKYYTTASETLRKSLPMPFLQQNPWLRNAQLPSRCIISAFRLHYFKGDFFFFLLDVFRFSISICFLTSLSLLPSFLF